AVIARHVPNGWRAVRPYEPDWWSGEKVAPPPVPQVVAPRPPKAGQLDMFGELYEPSPAVSGGWVAEFVASPAFVAQTARIRLPRPMPPERVARYLEAIDANGGSIPLATLAARVAGAPDTLRMALSLVQRLVNL